ncbi:MAG TPA: AmmeMemoRadiSam system radical SAM enzyme [Anaerolineae bacterium]|nr:AmmeMemoRadiSam system radical SAM enzyme [Anaerolineae bacterium]
MKEALLYEKLDGGRVRCHLCAHRCTIADGRRGVCVVRENRGGTLYSLVYSMLLSQAVDPIEKKPLFHFHPGTGAFSIATAGCNFACEFCQNATISQMVRDQGQIAGRQTPPEEVVRAAQRHDCRSIAYTYTEPTIFFEYTYDIARLAHAVGIASVYVTNGYMTPEMLALFQGTAGDHEPWLDAANVDLKAFRDETYRQICGARLQPVLDALVEMKRLGVWLEVTTLVVPGMNDSEAELGDIARFLAGELGPETPWHVSRFHPDYQMYDRDSTPPLTLRRAYELGREAGLHYVYVGNLPGARLEDTYCPHCDQTVVARWGFQVTGYAIKDGRCEHCGGTVHGVGM